MSRPVCQVWNCEEPATATTTSVLCTGGAVNVRVCRAHAERIQRAYEDQALDLRLQMARKRT